ncbi:MAG: 3'(2'),5'-bisphosphate nucleotidase CysQ [Candidatus Dormibacteraeota bacterium]|uniref:3'(2'),5'-bisphosphate nucleotidase CysQ n=1 Tax=Candidatus Aeolococcus gillhamiae TaxID=3127015 RepID=A0A2W5Z5A3_9BACT|nr:3'(2'),5'-bisphosphate nucleotidase CysQ [Candidatus Dormibacteraeota bacterium]PZR80529.1 MAG: 3'(2'),5'-bisphosphate nucleotidase CysQ [Candidatus Dormibacter sp. RRmetagenome_bin12]
MASNAAVSVRAGDQCDHELARRIAEQAGRALVALRDGAGPDADPQQLRDRGDRQSHELIMELLAELRPGDAVLSEEGTDDSRRLGERRVWIIDPLDGTREFGEPGRADWAVHVALVEEGTPVAAAVALPAAGLVFGTSPSPALPAGSGGPLRLVVSRSHTPPAAAEIARRLGAVLVTMGSAGAKTMAVVRGEAAAYVHMGGQYEWDSAAPVGVALSAGLCATRADGSPLRYNQPNPWLPDQVVCHPEHQDAILAAVRAVVDHGT